MVKELFKRSLVWVGIQPVVRCEWVIQDIILGYVGFVLIRCGKTRRHGNDCHEEKSFHTHWSLETGG